MRPAERRKRILELVQKNDRVSVDKLSEQLEISRETIRRDLALLSEQGLIRKVHGGATLALLAPGVKESPLAERRAIAREEKIRIAARAAQLFSAGDSILVNCGTTTIFFAEALAKQGPFTVITNSTFVAQEIWNSKDRGPIHLLGGNYFGEACEVLGPQVVELIKQVSADHAVIGVSGVGASGALMDFSAEEAYVSRAMIESAREVTVLADSSKLRRNALFHVCSADKITRLVTDAAPDAALENSLKLAGVEIIIAGRLDSPT